MTRTVNPLADTTTRYEPRPHYRAVQGAVGRGWQAAAATLASGQRCLAVDGPASLDWAATIRDVTAATSTHFGGPVKTIDMRTAGREWAEIVRLTRSPDLAEDPDFEHLAMGALSELLRPELLTRPEIAAAGALLIIGPGAAAVPGVRTLWWADLPKRYAEQAVARGTGRNLFAPDQVLATTKRLFYIDWPLLDRHRDEHIDEVDLWLDLQDPTDPTWLPGDVLRATVRSLAQQPIRTLPTFNSTPWGGQWARRNLGHNPDGPNTALGYELIAPESGVLVGENADRAVEIPFQLLAALAPVDLLGDEVHRQFGTSFPIRFDYLDNVDGGNLSVHCHPQPDYMREVFGWPYTQHETYYVMVGGERNVIFLGLREGASPSNFHKAAHGAHAEGLPFDITEFVQTFPAEEHQLFLIPAGAPHGSGSGNVVLEVSATPYLYSLRFYDWLRRDATDRQRPVHVDHAFANLDPTRSGQAIADQLVQSPRLLTSGTGWHEDLIGRLPDMFFEVHRLELDASAVAPQHTEGRFHVLTLVEGDQVEIVTERGHRHGLGYAETIAIPAAVGHYSVQCADNRSARLVKALVR